MLSGKWTYRSFRNDPALVGDDADAALALIFGEGIFDFDPAGGDTFRGGLGLGAGYALALTGEVIRSGRTDEYAIVGLGISGTATEGWRYDYRCTPGFWWPEGVGQVPSLVGTVVRATAHGPKAPSGYTASFVAVRQPPDRERPARTRRRSALTVGL
jgi:hypothetical protein